MIFKLTKTSTPGIWESEKEINTLEELLDFVKKHDKEVIIKKPYEQKHYDWKTKEQLPSDFTRWELEIYDDYRE